MQVGVGASTIRTLSDGAITLPASLIFDNMQQDELASLQRDSNLLKNDLFRECNVSLFENKTHKVLFDVGAGTCF